MAYRPLSWMLLFAVLIAPTLSLGQPTPLNPGSVLTITRQTLDNSQYFAGRDFQEEDPAGGTNTCSGQETSPAGSYDLRCSIPVGAVGIRGWKTVSLNFLIPTGGAPSQSLDATITSNLSYGGLLEAGVNGSSAHFRTWLEVYECSEPRIESCSTVLAKVVTCEEGVHGTTPSSANLLGLEAERPHGNAIGTLDVKLDSQRSYKVVVGATIEVETLHIGTAWAIFDEGYPGAVNFESLRLKLGEQDSADLGVGGSWYDPSLDGSGLVLEVVPPGDRLLAWWYAFRTDGSIGVEGFAERMWYMLDSRPYATAGDSNGFFDGRKGSLLVFETLASPEWPNDPSTLTTAIGRFDVEFTSCEKAVAHYWFTDRVSGQNVTGDLKLQRILPAGNCSLRSSGVTTTQ